MPTLYLICALIGGTVLVCQFVMTLFGLGADDFDFDTDVDVPDNVDFSDGSHHGMAGHGSTWIFTIISFKAVVAALAFFGIAGLAANSGELMPLPTLAIAVVCGFAAMVMIHWMMKGLHKLNQDGSLRIDQSVGHRGMVYIPIPASRSGEGKIQLKLQNRIVELKAMTSQAKMLPTGARVVISRVLTPSTVEVKLLPDATDKEHADASV